MVPTTTTAARAAAAAASRFRTTAGPNRLRPPCSSSYSFSSSWPPSLAPAPRSTSSTATGQPSTGANKSDSDAAGGCPVTGVKLRNVPTLPFAGSMIPQYSGTPTFDPTKWYEYYPTMRKSFGDFYTTGFPGLGKGTHGIFYVLTDPNEMLKVVRQERSKQPYPRGITETEWPLLGHLQSLGSVLGKGANDLEDKLGYAGRGETWKRLRTFFQTDMLSPQAANAYVPIMAEAAASASRGAPTSSDDLNAYTNRVSFDLFTAIMFGQLSHTADLSTGRDEENIEFCGAAVKFMETMLQQITSPLQHLLFNLGIRTSLYKDMASSYDRATGIAEKKYREFRKRMEAGELTEAEKSSYLGRAIVRQAEERSVSEEELAELIKIALTAAIDTTSSMMSWNLLQVALNPEAQSKLRTELEESVAKCGGLNAEALRKSNSPYLHAVLRETHRLTPSAPLTLFKENSLSDIEIHSTTVPKDSVFALDGHSVGLDPEMVDDPDQFRPERFLPEGIEARKGTAAEILDHPFYRDAFSQGSRKCPGARVANNEVLLIIARLVLDWQIGLPEGYGRENVTYMMKGFVHPNLPKLNFVARK